VSIATPLTGIRMLVFSYQDTRQVIIAWGDFSRNPGFYFNFNGKCEYYFFLIKIIKPI
jgi:hypothetical protein